jgi:hypothetical protein
MDERTICKNTPCLTCRHQQPPDVTRQLTSNRRCPLSRQSLTYARSPRMNMSSTKPVSSWHQSSSVAQSLSAHSFCITTDACRNGCNIRQISQDARDYRDSFGAFENLTLRRFDPADDSFDAPCHECNRQHDRNRLFRPQLLSLIALAGVQRRL